MSENKRLTITLDMCEKGVFLNSIQTGDGADCNIEGKVPITQSTTADDIADMISKINSGLELSSFSSAYVSKSETKSKAKYIDYEPNDHYYDLFKDTIKNIEGIDIPEVLIYLSELRKRGDYNQTMHDELYEMVTSENPNRGEWKPKFLSLYNTEHHENKIRPTYLRRDVNKTVKELIGKVNAAFENLFTENKVSIQFNYEKALRDMQTSINNGTDMTYENESIFKYAELVKVENKEILISLIRKLSKTFFVATEGVKGKKDENGTFRYPPTYCEQQNVLKRNVKNLTFRKQKLSCKTGVETYGEDDVKRFLEFLVEKPTPTPEKKSNTTGEVVKTRKNWNILGTRKNKVTPNEEESKQL